MIDVNLDFSGLEDIARDLQTLSKAENNKVLRDSTRAGAEVLRQEVIDRAPEQTGKLKKNVVVVTQKSRRRGEISSGVHIRGVNPRTGNSDNTMKASNKRNAFYWRFVELGTATAPAHPFVRPAFDTRQEEAAQAAMNRMNKAIDEVLAKSQRMISIPCCRRWQTGGFIRMWCRLAATIYPQWPLLTSFSRYRLMLPGMCSVGRPNRRCTFR